VDYIDEESADGTSTSTKQNENDQAFQLNTLEAAINGTIQKEMTLNDYKLEAMQSLAQRRLNPSSCQQGDEQSSCSLQSCLYKFTSPEILSGLNKFGCENCTRVHNRNNNSNKAQQSAQQRTVYTQAIKQYLLCELPAVLTIHLKRFQQHGYRLEKVNKHVNFPLQLDLSPYTSKHCTNLVDNANVVYSLYGLVEHSGRLNGGHYTAYVKSRKKQNIDKYLIRERLSALRPYLNWSSLNSFVCSQTDGSLTNSEEEHSENYTWYYISDSQVTEVPESKILKLQAYILFYERS
jgi:ubiquitin carboxyl-terminal hydrolase 16/45